MKTVSIHASTAYNILIEHGAIKQCGTYLASIFSTEKRLAIITDDIVASLYLQTVQQSLENAGYSVVSCIVPHGEQAKSQEVLFDVLSFLTEQSFTRSDCLIALGGGVVGDLTGFAASIYLRGIPFVQIPTTFLAAIDSSVGGKTAINLPAGKNLVGTFYQPSLVLCDPDTFSTLSAEIFADGCAEMIKYGMIASKELMEQIEVHETNTLPLEDIIAQCVSIKRDLVQQDERDRGQRMLLNYGHTLGHAIEKQSQHQITHGQAVAMGMVLISQLGERLGWNSSALTERLTDCLKRYRLPVEYHSSLSALGAGILHDKKRAGDLIHLVCVSEVGHAYLRTLPVEELISFLKG